MTPQPLSHEMWFAQFDVYLHQHKPRHGILYASASLRRLAFLRWKGL